MIRKIDHIGIAVRDLDRAIRTYTEGLGLVCTGQETVAGQKVRTAFLPAGDVNLEFLGSLDPEGPVGRFLEKRGEGVHHICFEVDDLRAELERCRKAGMQLIDTEPRRGAHGRLVAFVHPGSTHGVLVELSQRAEEETS